MDIYRDPEWNDALQYLASRIVATSHYANDILSARNTKKEDIEVVFGQCGTVKDVQFWATSAGGPWAFVTFSSTKEAQVALSMLCGQKIDYRAPNRVHIQWRQALKVLPPHFSALKSHYDPAVVQRLLSSNSKFKYLQLPPADRAAARPHVSYHERLSIKGRALVAAVNDKPESSTFHRIQRPSDPSSNANVLPSDTPKSTSQQPHSDGCLVSQTHGDHSDSSHVGPTKASGEGQRISLQRISAFEPFDYRSPSPLPQRSLLTQDPVRLQPNDTWHTPSPSPLSTPVERRPSSSFNYDTTSAITISDDRTRSLEDYLQIQIQERRKLEDALRHERLKRKHTEDEAETSRRLRVKLDTLHKDYEQQVNDILKKERAESNERETKLEEAFANENKGRLLAVSKLKVARETADNLRSEVERLRSWKNQLQTELAEEKHMRRDLEKRLADKSSTENHTGSATPRDSDLLDKAW
ncbi:hypothetical protein FRB99_001086 [Tulasnella sp. 403]|nr:hypothetical protein FRB99_001086 [Tulasnella sp. 403]